MGCKIVSKLSLFVSLLQSYSHARSLFKIKQLHAQIITSASLSLSSSAHSFTLCSNLASSYALCDNIPYARKLFDELPQPKLFLYNAIIRMYSHCGFPTQVITLYSTMLSSTHLSPDTFTYPFVVKACGCLSSLNTGVVVHGKVVSAGFGSDLRVLNSLLAMYMSCGAVETAKRAFYVMGDKDGVSWASMISGFVKNRRANDAVLFFYDMIDDGADVCRPAVVSVLSACGLLEDLTFGRTVHGVVQVKGLHKDVFVCNALVDMYARCGSMNDAKLVFDKVKERDVVTWTSLIKGYIINGNARCALDHCWMMHLEGVVPNSVTAAMLLQASGTLQAVKQGRSLHAWVVRRNLFYDEIIQTALIDMYAKCNHVNCSFLVFTQSSLKRVASWNAIISAYIHNGLSTDAVWCFKQMLQEAVDPDAITVTSLLYACADLSDGHLLFSLHCYLIISGFLSGYEVVRSLVDAYSKCGKFEYSQKIFSQVSPEFRDVSLWTALIAGYGAHGHGETAVLLYKHMVQSGVTPNEVTYTCVLDACSHAGLVDEGLEVFGHMLRNHQTTNPDMHHYTCMVDLLGRAGRLQEAYNLIKAMPFMPNYAVWGCLLGACAVHQNVEIGEIAGKSLVSMEPENTGNYVLLANIYASAGRWEDAENIRSMINNFRSGKTPGHSLVDVKVI